MVDGSGLENRRPARVRGFESHPLRSLINEEATASEPGSKPWESRTWAPIRPLLRERPEDCALDESDLFSNTTFPNNIMDTKPGRFPS